MTAAMSNYGTVATLPLAPGTGSNCAYYYNLYDSPNRPAVIDASQQHLWSTPPGICESIADLINVDIEELIRLNPSLDRENCVMEFGFSYCVADTRRKKTCEHRTVTTGFASR
ncbi:hypothetical protein N0V86_006759 [Didymella sp. IMI 355093]|nr:hypothetical protein N0V86_006759 [Didymella sp. IMI 355093]